MKKSAPLAVVSVAFAWLLVVPAGIGARAAQVPPAVQSALAAIDARIAGDFEKDGVGGLSIGVVLGTQLIWSRHYGYAETETKRVADNDTDYRVGSITKQFTALAMLQLVEQGRMRLTDPLEQYVPEIKQVQDRPAGTPPITLLQVATMHSGLAREPGCENHSVGPVSAWTKIVVNCLPATHYVNEPGTTYLYSNIGYASLGLAVERAGGSSFIDQVTKRILVPLGMTRSSLETIDTVRANLAHGYQRRRDGAVSREAPDRELDGRGYRVPNGALFSTVTDMAKFLVWELKGTPDGILKKETQDANYARAFFSNANMTSGYGVGFQVTRRGTVVMLGHGGSTAGYHSSLQFHRGSGLGVVVLRNCDSCTVDAGPVATRALEELVTAAAIR